MSTPSRLTTNSKPHERWCGRGAGGDCPRRGEAAAPSVGLRPARAQPHTRPAGQGWRLEAGRARAPRRSAASFPTTRRCPVHPCVPARRSEQTCCDGGLDEERTVARMCDRRGHVPRPGPPAGPRLAALAPPAVGRPAHRLRGGLGAPTGPPGIRQQPRCAVGCRARGGSVRGGSAGAVTCKGAATHRTPTCPLASHKGLCAKPPETGTRVCRRNLRRHKR